MKNIKAFTIMELLVIIAVIAILTTVSLVGFNSLRQSARDSERLSEIGTIREALENYRSKEGFYPPTLTPGQALVGPTSGLTFLKEIPSNPQPRTDNNCPDSDYLYTVYSNGISYSLQYCLAKKNNDLAAGYHLANYKALSYCAPACLGKNCGDNGCGGTCGSCSAGYLCSSGTCTLDTYTVLLLHMNGADNGTTFTDSSNSAHTMTVTNALTKTAVQKFGTASGYFDGYHDFLSTPDSADWNLAAGDFTIDAWVRGTSTNNGTGLRPVVAQWEHQVSTEFSDNSYWSTFDASTINSGLKGYNGAVFDGHYVYFVPYYDGTITHGKVLRYDTRNSFTTAGNWAYYDAGSTGGYTTKGYHGAAFDGRYVYFVPYWNGAYHGKVLRYDTQNDASFNTAGNWSAYDAENEDGSGAIKGYLGAVFDGRYVYFVPFYNGSAYHGKFLRFDTQGNFSSGTAWDVYNAGTTGGLDTKGYDGGVFDGRYIYFVPYRDSTGAFHGRVLRYDTQNDAGFNTAANWKAYDAGNISPNSNTKGYTGGAFDGQYVYFAPFYDNTTGNGKVLRYNTQNDANFNTAGNWSSYNAGTTSGLTTKGFGGAIFEGQYVYFAPYWDGSAFHGRVLRYIIQGGAFDNSSNWSAKDAGGIGTDTKGYVGIVSDGRYLYFAPYRDGSSTYHSKVLRYDTKSQASAPVFKLLYADIGNDGIGAGPLGPSFYFNIGNYVYGLHAKQTLSANTWYHLAVVRSGNDFKLYVDGVLKDSLTQSGTLDNGSSYLTVGELWNGGYNASFNGYLDEVRVYKGAAYWTSAFTPPTSEY